ncbi:MAG: LLM class flavin-dependent oxidoreductase [Acidimicrobiia bacterium]
MRHAVLVQAVDPPGEFSELARTVERTGADHFFVADSSLHARAVWPYLTLAALVTESIRIGTGVTHPKSRHPAITANAIATLDEISRGRAVLGLGSGDRPLLELGLGPARLETLEDAIHMMRRLLAGETLSEGGLTGAALLHHPNKRLPIVLAASGPRTLRMAGRVADGVLIQAGTDPRCIEVALKDVARGVEEAGRNPSELWTSVMAYGSVRDDPAVAHAESRHFAAWIPQTVPRYCDIAGIPMSDVSRVQAAYSGGELMKADSAAETVSSKMVEAFTLAGTPDQVRQRLSDMADVGVDHVTFFPMAEDRITAVQRFAEMLT